MDSYRRRSFIALRLDPERAALLPAGQSRALAVDGSSIELLHACGGSFRTLEHHAEKSAHERNLSAIAPGELRRLLAAWAESGALLSKVKLLERARQASRPAPPAIEAVCVATRDRPDAVRRCIGSYAANIKAFGRSCSWTVLDSSSGPDGARRTREALRALAAEAIEVHYADVEDKALFATKLAAESGVDPEVVRFGLFDVDGMGHDTGGNRNALLLAHAGGMILNVDDDTVCELRMAPGLPRGEMELTSLQRPEYLLFPSIEDVRASLPLVQRSILGAHEELLGRGVGECLGAREASEVIADELTESAIEILLAGRGRVGATFPGIWGDCASTSPANYLFRQGASPAALPNDQETYRRVVASRQVLRTARTLTLGQFAPVMTATFGVDLRDLCPPMFPTRRGQDHVFGSLLRCCFEDHFFGFLPLAMGHLPVVPRLENPDDLWGTAKPKFNALLSYAMTLSPIELARSGAPRVRLLGHHLFELGSLPWPEFERLLLRRTWEAISNDIRLVQGQLSIADPASPWASDARGYVEALWEALKDTDILLPAHFRAGRSLEAARAMMQHQLRRFGQLLQAWPEIFAAAKRLRERGIALAKRLDRRQS